MKQKITNAEMRVSTLLDTPLMKMDTSIPSPAPTSIKGINVAMLAVNPIDNSPSAGNGNFWAPYKMNAIPSKNFNTTGPRNSKLSRNLFNNKSNLFIFNTMIVKIYGQYLFAMIFTSTIYFRSTNLKQTI